VYVRQALRAGAASLALAALCLPAWAGDNTNDLAALKSLSLEDLAAVQVDTVVGASKHEQKVTDAPSDVSIVTADDIKKEGYRTLADVLRSVRGFYVTYDRGYDYLGTRGMSIPGDFGGRLLITVDGHRMNDPIFDTAAIGTDFILDVDLIERVEVIRGPGSSLYGNNAFLGVINIITRKGSDVNGAELAGSAATFDTYTGRLTYGNRFTNGLDLMLSGTLYDSAGNPHLYYPEFSAINNGVAQNMDGGWARSAFASISWNGLSLEGGFVDRKKTWPTAPYSTPNAIVIFNDPSFFTIDERAFADLKLQHTFENEWELMARIYYDHYRFDAQYPYNYLDPLVPVTLNRDFARSESVGSEVQVTKTFFEQHRLTAGAEVRYDFRLDQANFDVDPPASYLDSRASANFFSFYAQDEYQALKNLILNAGVRYDYFSTFGGTANPRAALIYHPWEPTTFKLIYGQAFRAPNAYEEYYVSTDNEKNPHLGPETIRSYELVCEQKVGQHWSGSASLFFNDIKNLIHYQQDPASGLFSFANVDSVRAEGAEFEVDAQWASGLRGRASYAYTCTQDATTGQRLSNSPEHLGQLQLSVPLWRDKLFASMELEAMSDRQTVGGNTVGPVWLVNATLFSQKIAKGLEVSASVYNLLDRRYSDPVSPDFTQDSIQQDGRQFRLKLTYRF
jgi:outer membrane receptor for ferrienterochelin and colicins